MSRVMETDISRRFKFTMIHNWLSIRYFKRHENLQRIIAIIAKTPVSDFQNNIQFGLH